MCAYNYTVLYRMFTDYVHVRVHVHTLHYVYMYIHSTITHVHCTTGYLQPQYIV